MSREKEQPKFLTILSEESAWTSMLESSMDKLIVLDCHLEWCGPCEAVHPTFQRIFLDYDDCSNRLAVCSANFESFAEKIQAILPGDSKINVEKNGCLPLFIFIRHKSCIAYISGVDAPLLMSNISNNIPDKKKKTED